MYQILKMEGRAKRGRMNTVHGAIETPVFMNVGTVAAIKGAVSTEDLEGIGTQVELSNTYHLHVRPGDGVEPAHSHGFRRLSGVFTGRAAPDQRGRRVFSLPYRRAQDFYGPGGEYADPVQSGIHHCHGF